MCFFFQGHGKESRNVLSTYLPGSGHGGGAYAESGSLYALGLIHANHCDEPMKEYLLQQLRAAHNSEVLQHGACLGLGLVALGTADDSEAIASLNLQLLLVETSIQITNC